MLAYISLLEAQQQVFVAQSREPQDNPTLSNAQITPTTFTATCSLNADRVNYGVAILNSVSHSGDLAVFAGLCAENTLSSFPIGTSAAATNCKNAKYQTDYYELFNPSAGTWAVGTGTTPATPAAGPASALLP